MRLGLVMLEAMAFGGTNCTKISAIPEVVKDGFNGLLTTTDNVKSYVNAMKKLENFKFRKIYLKKINFILKIIFF